MDYVFLVGEVLFLRQVVQAVDIKKGVRAYGNKYGEHIF